MPKAEGLAPLPSPKGLGELSSPGIGGRQRRFHRVHLIFYVKWELALRRGELAL